MFAITFPLQTLVPLDHRFNPSHPRFTLAMDHGEVCFKLRETTPQSMVSFRKQCQSMQKLVRNYKLGSKDMGGGDLDVWKNAPGIGSLYI